MIVREMNTKYDGRHTSAFFSKVAALRALTTLSTGAEDNSETEGAIEVQDVNGEKTSRLALASSNDSRI